MRILICGDREWNNFKIINDFIKSLPKDTIIIEGDCRGVDKIAGYLARRNGLIVEVYQANWKKYGKVAGPIRNKEMLDNGNPDLVIAFHNNIENSKGTKNMISQAIKRRINIRIIKDDFYTPP